MKEKILNFINIILISIFFLFVIYVSYTNNLFVSEKIFSIEKENETVSKKDYDKEGKLIIVVWGIGAHPEAREFNQQLPIKEWLLHHKKNLLQYEMLKEFERRNPNIKIVVEFGRECYNTSVFIPQVSADQGPDVFFNMASSAVPTLAKKGFVIKLDDYVNKWERKDDFREVAWLPNMYANHYYALPDPWQNYVVGLIYRRDLLIKAGFVDKNGNAIPPKTWKELAEYGIKIKNKIQCYNLGFDGSSGSGGWNLQDYLWQGGTEIVKKIGNRWEAVFATDEAVKTLEYIRSLKYKYQAIQPDINLGTWEQLPEYFIRGEIVMYKSYAADYFTILQRGYLNPFEIGFAPLPAGPTGSIAQWAGGGWVVTKQVKSKDKLDAIWKLLTFLASEEMIEWRVKRKYELGIPIYRYETAFKNFDEANYVPEYEEVPYFLQILSSAKVEPYCYNYERVKGILDDVIQITLLDPKADIKKILKDYQEYANHYFLAEEKE